MTYVVRTFVANFNEATMEPAAELVRIELLMGAAPTGNNDACNGDARNPRKADQFPGHPHRCVAYGS